MIRNYVKIAWRNLIKNKVYSTITIGGLAIGLAASTVLALYVINEYSFDRFHPKAKLIYRVYKNIRRNGIDNFSPLTAAPLAQAVSSEFPQVEATTRLLRSNTGELVAVNRAYFNEKAAFYADASFFDLFAFPFMEGQAKGALDKPNTVVITQSKAKQYFGTQSPLGKTLFIGGDKTAYQVTGVIYDPPVNSHMHPALLLSMASLGYSQNTNWLSNDFYTYVLLRPDASGEQLQANLPLLVQKYVGPQLDQVGESLTSMRNAGDRWDYFIQPLTDIHLRSGLNFELEANGNETYVNILAVVSVLILLIAAINFINLSTARSTKRALEIGLRKSFGSLRTQLIGQFLLESLLQSLIAMALATGLIGLSLYTFSGLLDQPLLMNIETAGWLALCLSGLAIVVGLLAGLYPAIYLSSFRPISTLKGQFLPAKGGQLFRNALVVIQFTISITLISCALLIYRQLNFLQNHDIGFAKENIITITNADQLGDKERSFAQTLRQQSQIIAVSYSDKLPALSNFGVSSFSPSSTTDPYLLRWFEADTSFIQTLGLHLKQGRNFSPAFSSDSASVILNQAAVRYLGLKHPLDQTLKSGIYGHPSLKVIGVVADFNFESLQQAVKPCALLLGRQGQYLSIRVRAGGIRTTVNQLSQQWKNYLPSVPIEYAFLDQTVDQLYRSEQRLERIFTLFTSLSILVACLGLYGLVTYTTEQRRKEIGVRKVLGASVISIVSLLSQEFLRLVGIAILIASPLSWYLMRGWLQHFAYRTLLSWWVFALSGLLAVIIALLTASLQTTRAAYINPIQALKSD